MNEPRTAPQPSSGGAPPPAPVNPAEIDVSCRTPLIALFLCSVVWLVASSLFALIASLHFHSPRLLADCACLGYGRVQPAALESLLYGFCIPSGLGIALWLFARLGRTPLAHPGLVVIGAIFWNLGMALGIGGILLGDRTGFACLDMPGYAAPALLVGYLLAGLSAALTFHRRTEFPLFVSQWFLLAALFWFPWIYSTAEIFLVHSPVRGVAQAAIAWWYANNLETVYLWLVGLGAVFYFLPKLTGNTLQSRYLALLTFWMVLLFSSWAGIPASAPTPAWMPTLSLVGTVLNLVPVLAVWLSAARTSRPASPTVAPHSPLHFVRFGVAAFVLAGLMQVFSALPYVCDVTDFTWFGPARTQLNLLGFFAMVAFGAIYFIVPRLAGFECLGPKGTRAHFWLSACGIILVVVPEAAAGILEGLKLQAPNAAFLSVASGTLHFLRISTLGLLLIALGQGCFLVNLSIYAFRSVRQFVAAHYATLTADLFKPTPAKP